VAERKIVKNKVIVIKGWANIAREVTLGEFERINADHVALICAIRRPQLLPGDIIPEPQEINSKLSEILQHWKSIEVDHLLVYEYASFASERRDVRVIEGECLRTPWFFETVRSLHKFEGSSVVEGDITFEENGIRIKIGEQEFSRNEAINYLRLPPPFLG
jgi:hypothetical protein